MLRSVATALVASFLASLSSCAAPARSIVPVYDQILEEEDLRRDPPTGTLAALHADQVELRRRAARCLGRLRNASFAAPLERQLENEADASVRLECAFALGQIASSTSLGALRKLLADPERSVRAAAVEALAKLQDESLAAELLRLMLDTEPEVRTAAALAQHRLGAKRSGLRRTLDAAFYQRRTELLGAAVTDAAPEVRYAAALALAEIGDADGGPALRRGLRDREPEVRRVCVWGLALLPVTETASEAIGERLWDNDWRVIVEALRGLPAAASEPRFTQRLLELANGGHPSFHVRAAAAEALGLRPALAGAMPALQHALADASETVRGSALFGLARLQPENALPAIRSASASSSWRMRHAAARAAALVPGAVGLDLLRVLLIDADLKVRAAALEALQATEQPRVEIRRACLAALDAGDAALGTLAAQGLKKCGEAADGERLEQLCSGASSPDQLEFRLAAVDTIAALLKERSLGFLKSALADADLAVRRAAAAQLKTLTGEVFLPAPNPVVRQVMPRAGVDYLVAAPNPVVYLKTDKGLIGIELLRDEAPTHVKNFLELMQQGVYDGLTFHRVESNWVIQGLDPRGDGWGTGNRSLRDEVNRVPFQRGTVGMPNAGPDTGGCQIFIMQIHAPRLDGRYTSFGRVVAGMDVVDSIEVGDRIQWVRPASYLLEHREETTSVTGIRLPTQ
ncbi:MAG: HEAT repeat domain-containing protein [Planctomycetota bacterium]